MYIYFDRNKVLREIINDEAIVQGLNRNKIFIYYELQGDEVLTFNSGKFRLSDNSEVDILSSEVTTISDLSSDAAFIPYNKDRDLKFFKYGKAYPFTVITVNSSVYSESGVVLGTVTVTANGYGAETLERFTFMVEETNGIETSEPIDISLYEYLLKLFANKNVFAVTAVPQDVSIYNVDDLLINLTNKKLYRITGSPKAASLWLDLSDLATDTDLQAEIARATLAEETLDDKIDAETDRATDAEDALDDKIDAEIERATTAEDGLADDIEAEETRAKVVEDNLDDKIDTEIANRKALAGHSIDMTIDSNFDLVIKLLNANGVVISQDDIDLPLESIVVSATYYDTYTYEGVTYNKVIVIVLATTSVPTIVPVGDLVSGLVSTDELATALVGYYTKAQVESLLNGKVDKVNGKGLSTNDFTNADKSKLDGIEAGAEVNVLEGVKVNGTDLIITDKKVDIVYDDKLDEDSENPVQNKVITQNVLDLQYRVAMLEEAIIGEDTLSYTHLSESLIPNVSDNSYPIIQGAGLDTKEIKGRSFVYNQLLDMSGVASVSANNVTITNNGDGSFTVSTTAEGASADTYTANKWVELINGHKYLLYGVPSGASSSTYYVGGTFNKYNNQIFKNAASTGQKAFSIIVKQGAIITTPVIFELCLVDLTQSGIDSATTVDEAIALLQQNGINPYEYNSYNTGTIIDSKPTAIVSKGFNIWDEEWELGIWNSDGNKETNNSAIRSSNYIKVIPNKEYYLKCGSEFASGIIIRQYDENKNFIGTIAGTKNAIFTTVTNCEYITICSYATDNVITYNYDICINISSSLNGTYKPYKAPITYPLSIPVLRSAGSVQDNNLKINIGVVDLGTLSWEKATVYSKTCFRCQISGLKHSTNDYAKQNILTAPYETIAYQTLNSNVDKVIAVRGTATIDGVVIYNSSKTSLSATEFKTAMSGVMLNFELATPTDQPSITLPENMEIELGGSLEVLYDDGHTTPCDFVFDTAVYKPIQ